MQNSQLIFFFCGNWYVWSFEIFLIDDIINTFSLVLSNMLRLSIFKFFVMLNCKILFFNMFFEFFSLLVAYFWFFEAMLNLLRIITISQWISTRSTIFIIPIIKLIDELKLISGFINLSCRTWVHECWFLLIVNIPIKRLGSVNKLMLKRAFFWSISKSNSLDPIWILWITTPRISLLLFFFTLCQLFS